MGVHRKDMLVGNYETHVDLRFIKTKTILWPLGPVVVCRNDTRVSEIDSNIVTAILLNTTFTAKYLISNDMIYPFRVFVEFLFLQILALSLQEGKLVGSCVLWRWKGLIERRKRSIIRRQTVTEAKMVCEV